LHDNAKGNESTETRCQLIRGNITKLRDQLGWGGVGQWPLPRQYSRQQINTSAAD